MDAVASAHRVGVVHVLRSAWPMLGHRRVALAIAVARVLTPVAVVVALLAGFLAVTPDVDDVSPYVWVLVGLVLLELAIVVSAFPRAVLLAVAAGRPAQEACAVVARHARDVATWAQSRSTWRTPAMFTLAVMVVEDVDLATVRHRSPVIHGVRWGATGRPRGDAARTLAIAGVVVSFGLELLPVVGSALSTFVLVAALAAAALARALLTVGVFAADVGLTAEELDRLVGR